MIIVIHFIRIDRWAAHPSYSWWLWISLFDLHICIDKLPVRFPFEEIRLACRNQSNVSFIFRVVAYYSELINYSRMFRIFTIFVFECSINVVTNASPNSHIAWVAVFMISCFNHMLMLLVEPAAKKVARYSQWYFSGGLVAITSATAFNPKPSYNYWHTYHQYCVPLNIYVWLLCPHTRIASIFRSDGGNPSVVIGIGKPSINLSPLNA